MDKEDTKKTQRITFAQPVTVGPGETLRVIQLVDNKVKVIITSADGQTTTEITMKGHVENVQ